MNDTGQGESRNNTNKPHLNSTPSSKPLSAILPTPDLPILQGPVDVPLLELPLPLFRLYLSFRVVCLSTD